MGEIICAAAVCPFADREKRCGATAIRNRIRKAGISATPGKDPPMPFIFLVRRSIEGRGRCPRRASQVPCPLAYYPKFLVYFVDFFCSLGVKLCWFPRIPLER